MANKIKKEKMKKYNDPKTHIISMQQFLEEHSYFSTFSPEKCFFDASKKPEYGTFLKFAATFFAAVSYTLSFNCFSGTDKVILESIDVAYRDGKTEYELIKAHISQLKNGKKKNAKGQEIIKKIEQIIKNIPKYNDAAKPESKPFEEYLSFSNYKTSNDTLKDKYVVIDVETNGLRRVNDDLLSLSIYDPTTGACYDRIFPHELQPVVLTTYINGISDEDVEKAFPLTQKEVDWLIDYFHLNSRTVLSYSGDGRFDVDFLANYCKRNGIIGLDNLKTQNIKSKLPRVPYGFEGTLSKDNACKLFGIDGVKEIHSGKNDCVLEWKLFETIGQKCLVFKNEVLFELAKDYVVPVTYLNRYPEIKDFFGIDVPNVVGRVEKVFEFHISNDKFKIKKFSTNITGIAIEHGLNALLKVKKQDNKSFLSQNARNLKKIGYLEGGVIKSIPVIRAANGLLSAVKSEDELFVKEVNVSTEAMLDALLPLKEYIQQQIFEGQDIMSQELVFSNDKKVMAVCDLSNEKNVVEIKTFGVLSCAGLLNEQIAMQLFYQSRGRNTYVLSLIFESNNGAVEAVNVFVYRVYLDVTYPCLKKQEELQSTQLDKITYFMSNPSLESFLKIRKNSQTTEIVNKAIEADGLAIEHLSKKIHITKEMLETAARSNGRSLKFISENYTADVTKDMCWNAIVSCGEMIKYVPGKYQTKEMAESAVSQPISRRNLFVEYPIKYVLHKFITPELLKKSIEANPASIKDIPGKFLSDEIVEYARRQGKMIYGNDYIIESCLSRRRQ